MTKEQKKKLTEKLLEEEWFDESLCAICGKTDKMGFHAHYGNDYDAGKHDFEPQTNRTFLTPDDQQACMEALVREGLWGKFIESVFVWRGYRDFSVEEVASKVNQLFRPVNEAGEAHFCALVVEFLEVKDGQK